MLNTKEETIEDLDVASVVETIKTIFKNSQFTSNTVRGVVLHAVNITDKKPIIAEMIGDLPHDKEVRFTLSIRNLLWNFSENEPKKGHGNVPLAIFESERYLFILAGLDVLTGQACLMAMAVKTGLLSEKDASDMRNDYFNQAWKTWQTLPCQAN